MDLGWREVVQQTRAGTTHLSFAARWGGEPVLNGELDDFKWLAPDALGDLELTDGLADMLNAASRLISA